MNYRKGITKLELVIIIIFISIAITLIIAVLNVRHRPGPDGNRAVCLGNLKRLQLAWSLYADDNNGMICAATLGNEINGAPAWCGNAWGGPNMTLPEGEQIEAIKQGALWPYVKNVDYYSCYRGLKDQMVTYSVMDSMNGSAEGLGSGKDEEGLFITNKLQMKNPSERMVFIDIGWISPSGYTAYYDMEQWFNLPPIRHNNGTNSAFADGHAEFYKWRGQTTIDLGKLAIQSGSYSSANQTLTLRPQTPEDADDLQLIQESCSGKLGYEPSF